MECLKSYVGLQGCGASVPESGRYINELPGISLESIENLSNSEQITYSAVWNNVKERSVVKFRNKIISAFSKRYRKRTIQQSINIGKIIDASNTTAAINQYRGFSVELTPENNLDFTRSNLFTVSWQSLSLYLISVPASDVTVKIWDMETSEEVATFTILQAELTTGWNEIKVNQLFYSKSRLFVGFDSQLITVPYLRFNSTNDGYIRGAQTIVKTEPNNLTYSESTHGLSGVFSVLCTFDSLICDNKKTFVDAWLYQLGEELLIEGLFTDRWNWWTLDKDKAVGMREYYKDQTDININLAIDGINLDLNDSCLECNQQIRIMEQTP